MGKRQVVLAKRFNKLAVLSGLCRETLGRWELRSEEVQYGLQVVLCRL